MLYRGGRPTSVVLLLLMVVAQLSLPLSCHPPLGLHHLFRLVGAARALVSLRSVEILKVRTVMRAAVVSKFRHLARAAVSRASTTIWYLVSVVGSL